MTVSNKLGSPIAFMTAVILVIIWAICGPFLGFSEVWQLTINTATTIITFLMVFLVQASQNNDTRAIHLKLDEIIRSLDEARDDYMGAERLSRKELENLDSATVEGE
jgi:low affinity Fe/Cu permease